MATQGTVVDIQRIVKAIPINQLGSTEQLVILIEDIRKQGFEHKKLPFWNLYFHIIGL